MKVSERSEYGERLVKAREQAKLSQKELAQKAGMSQSNLAGLERDGKGSAKTARLAAITGVRTEWLADGKGDMLDEPPAAARQVASERVAHRLVGTEGGTDWRTIAMSLAAALEETGTKVSIPQFIKLVEATHAKLNG